MSTRIPPQHLEAEQSIIGGLMLDHEAFDQVADLIETADFYKPAHQKIYQAIKELHTKAQPIDIITVTNLLQAKDELEVSGGPEYLVSLLDKTISAANIQTHAGIVREKSLLRRLISTSSGLIERAYSQDYTDIESLIDQAEAEVLKVGETKSKQGLVGSMEIVKSSIEKIEELFKRKTDITGLATGFAEMDKMTAGLHPGELTIIAARPSMGKTAFSLNIAQHAVLRLKKTVAYFSLEMGKESMMMRLLSAEAKVSMGEIRTGRIQDSSWPKLISAAGALSEAGLFIDDTPGISPFEIRARCRRLKAQHGLDMVMIDYLQLMDLKQKVESRERAVSEISKALKTISKELQIPVIALAQLNRGVEGRSDRRPMLSDLRESGSIEQDADVIMLLYRDDYYDKEDPDKQGHAEVIIGKQRNGATGTIKLRFDAKYSRFRDPDPESVGHSGHSMASPQGAPPPMPGKPRNFAPGANS
ncbi:MAG: replicative DNA helicase [Bdellovibrionaceae bacterium]|nr:replicative DNA helicase [Pseudobdellovibrionaceae bacterium]